MKFMILVAATLASLAPRLAHAEGCHPPAPGTWEDKPKVKANPAGARPKAVEETPEPGAIATLLSEGVKHLEAARALEGAAQRAEAVTAEQRFRDVEARVPCLPSTVVLLARALRLQGRYLEAAAQYRRLLDSRAELEEQRFWDAWLADAEREQSETLAQTPRLVLHLERNDCPSSPPRVALNHRPARLDTSLRLDAGSYFVKVEAKGCVAFSKSISLVGGDEAQIAISLRKAPCTGFACSVPTWMKLTGGGALVAGIGIVTYALLKPNAAPRTSYDCPDSLVHKCLELP
jgi:hypothetical protein